MTRRERAVFACLVDTLLEPTPPLPPVEQTDAVDAFATLLAAAPPVNRATLRGVLLSLAATRWTHRTRAERTRALKRLGPLFEGVRSAAAVAYYGDPGVQAVVRRR